MKVITEKKQENKKRKRISKELIYEMRHGSPIYYRDYDKVLSGEKTLEEVMGSGGLQSYLVMLIANILFEQLKKKYFILINEVGYKFAPRSWYNLDIAIIDKSKLKEIPEGYITVPPEAVIEIDTKADLRKFKNPQDYFHRKTQDLLDSGIKKVIWIFTKEKKVWVAEKGKRWFITDWNDTIEILDDIKINLHELLEKEKH
ncbi:Uma2 family endonuclease [Persephonella sp.]